MQVMTPTFLEDADPFSEAFRRQSDGKMPESMKNFDVLNVNQLIESVCAIFEILHKDLTAT